MKKPRSRNGNGASPVDGKLSAVSIRAKDPSGCVIVDESAPLLDGPTANLLAEDESDELDKVERQALNEHLAAAWKNAQTGNVRPADQLLARLRSRR